MAWNISTYDTSKISFGPGVLFIAPLGTTPSDNSAYDIGAVTSGAELSITREMLDVQQGNPKQLIKRWVTAESVQLTVNGLEIDTNKLAKSLGAGVTTTAGTLDTLLFGSDVNAQEYSVSFRHQMPSGTTVYIDLWKAQPSGEMTMTFGDEPVQVPYVFVAQDSANEWGSTSNAATNSKGRLLRIRYQR